MQRTLMFANQLDDFNLLKLDENLKPTHYNEFPNTLQQLSPSGDSYPRWTISTSSSMRSSQNYSVKASTFQRTICLDFRKRMASSLNQKDLSGMMKFWCSLVMQNCITSKWKLVIGLWAPRTRFQKRPKLNSWRQWQRNCNQKLWKQLNLKKNRFDKRSPQ